MSWRSAWCSARSRSSICGCWGLPRSTGRSRACRPSSSESPGELLLVAALTGTLMFMTNARVYCQQHSVPREDGVACARGPQHGAVSSDRGKKGRAAGRRRRPHRVSVGLRRACRSPCGLRLFLRAASSVLRRRVRRRKRSHGARHEFRRFSDWGCRRAGIRSRTLRAAPAPSPRRPRTMRRTSASAPSWRRRSIPAATFCSSRSPTSPMSTAITTKHPELRRSGTRCVTISRCWWTREKLLVVPGRKAAEPGDRSSNPAVENEPEQVQKLLDSQHPDFVARAGRLREAATLRFESSRCAGYESAVRRHYRDRQGVRELPLALLVPQRQARAPGCAGRGWDH